MRGILCAAMAALAVGVATAAPEAVSREAKDRAHFQSRGISFYATFDESLTADHSDGRRHPVNPLWAPLYHQQKITFPKGNFGNCAVAESMRIVYDPAKVFFPDRGAVSFWFKPVKGEIRTLFQVTAKEWGVGPNSLLQRDLYWATFLFGTSSLIREGFYRALIRPALDPIEECFHLPDLDRDRWHHFLWTWDNTQGMRGYLDGSRIFDNWGTVTWIQMMTPNLVHFGSIAAIDELYLFRRALSPDEAGGLFRGVLPDPVKEEESHAIPEALQRDVAHSYGLDEFPAYPAVRPGAPVTFKSVDFDRALDGKRPMLYCLDGNRVSCWPDSHVELVNTDYLDIIYPGETEANYFRVIAEGNRFALSKNGDEKPFWADEVREERDGWADKLVRRHFSRSPMRFNRLRLDRKGARVGEFYVYHIEEKPLDVPDGKTQTFFFGEIGDIRDLAWEGSVYQRYHNHPSPVALGATAPASGDPGVIRGNPLVPFHLVAPAFSERTGVAAVDLELAVTPPENKQEDIVRIRIVDPVTRERDLFNTEFRLRFDLAAEGPQVFRLGLDMPDFVFNKGSRIWIWAVSKGGSELNLRGSRLTAHTIPVATAAERMVKRTMRLVAHTYSYASEGHRWSRSYKWPGDEMFHYCWSMWAGLLNIVQNQLAPENRVVGTYWHTIRPRTHRGLRKWVDYSKSEALRTLEHARIEAPENWPNPASAPEWALYQNELLKSFRRIVHWWHDKRLVYETGILGGYGDDTQFTGDAFWIHTATGDRKLFRILEAVTNGSWKYSSIRNGFPSRINDVGHDAEEVVGAWPLMILADYGNPRYVEMTMETMSLLDVFTTKTRLGHRHFKSWYLGANGMKTRGRYGVDNLANAQYALLGHVLGWYNRCPKLVEFYREWCDAWMADFKRAKAMNVKGALSIRMPDDVPIPHVGGMSSHTMQHHFFATGLLTGDDRYINRALNNDDKVFLKYYRGEWNQGMLLRNFAFMRHRLFEEERLKTTRAATRPSGVFGRYLLAGDKSLLAKEYERKLRLFAGGMEYLYTQGQPALDRLWGLYDETMFLAMLGGTPTGHRRSTTWPGMAVSFVDAEADLASLVLENRVNEAKILLFNFHAQRKSVDLRLWHLEPGEYEITLGPDRNGEDRMDTVVSKKRLEIERGSRVRLPVPFGVLQVAHFRQLTRKTVPRLLPDLAVGPEDVRFHNGRLAVTVHNIGGAAAPPSVVELLKKGTVLQRKPVNALEAPVDLRPRTTTVTFSDIVGGESLAVRVTPPEGAVEITTVNNQLAFTVPR